MHFFSCETPRAYAELFHGETFVDWFVLERLIATTMSQKAAFVVPGLCMACYKPVNFLTDRADGGQFENGVWQPRWAESQKCPACGLNSRQRASVRFLSRAIDKRGGNGVRIHFMEQSTPTYAHCKRMFPDVEIIGREYLGTSIPHSTVSDNIQFADAENLAFESGSFDLVLSNDLLDHVADPMRALSEIVRVLRPTGELFLTVPFHGDQDRNVRRATIVDGKITEPVPNLNQGNPVCRRRSPVFTDFGWELLQQLRDSGFQHAVVNLYWSYVYGFLGVPQLFIHAVM